MLYLGFHNITGLLFSFLKVDYCVLPCCLSHIELQETIYYWITNRTTCAVADRKHFSLHLNSPTGSMLIFPFKMHCGSSVVQENPPNSITSTLRGAHYNLLPLVHHLEMILFSVLWVLWLCHMRTSNIIKHIDYMFFTMLESHYVCGNQQSFKKLLRSYV